VRRVRPHEWREGGREGPREKGRGPVVCLPQTAREDPGIHSGGRGLYMDTAAGARKYTMKNNRAMRGHTTSVQCVEEALLLIWSIE
jgi:hypothetical protein